MCEKVAAWSSRLEAETCDPTERGATAHLDSKKLLPEDKGAMQSILAGSLRLGERLWQAGLSDSPTCPFCHMANESLTHCFWHCGAWAHLRLDPDLPSDATRRAWPACTQECGIFLEDPELVAAQEALGAEVEEPVSALAEDAQQDEHTVVWTDGACRMSRDHRLRRAGSGIFYGPDHPGNKALILPGRVQTNQRAELFAVVVALECDTRSVEIRSDSMYVVKGAHALQEHGAAALVVEHTDLGRRLQQALQLPGRGGVVFTWVKGHAKQIDVDRGRVNLIDKLGNDGADLLAVEGARAHPVPRQVLKRAVERRKTAVAVHEMMLKILQARRRAEALLGLNGPELGADRGSDCDLEDVAQREELEAELASENEWVDLSAPSGVG